MKIVFWRPGEYIERERERDTHGPLHVQVGPWTQKVYTHYIHVWAHVLARTKRDVFRKRLHAIAICMHTALPIELVVGIAATQFNARFLKCKV